MDQRTARVGNNNRTQIVTIPLEYRFPEGMKEVFIRKVGDEIVLSRLREREVDNKITVGDNEVDNLLGSLQLQDGKIEEFDLSHILIRVPEQVSPEQLRDRRARAEQVRHLFRRSALLWRAQDQCFSCTESFNFRAELVQRARSKNYFSGLTAVDKTFHGIFHS